MLQRRLQELAEEIRHYPGPIAGCDEHLAALLDERRRAMNELMDTVESGGCSPSAKWINDGGFNAA